MKMRPTVAARMIRTPILIVGGGPCGMLLSTLLSRYRVPSLLVEKGGPEPMSHPRAHVLNARAMEILRRLGLENDLNVEAPPKEDWTHFRYCETLLGDCTAKPPSDFAFVDHTRTKEYRQILTNSPCRVTQISQPILEKHLRRSAHEHLLQGSQILYNHEVIKADLGKKQVTVISNRTGASMVVAPDVVIAADGARSLVRESTGISLQGRTFLESFVSVHFSSPELGRRLRSSRKTAMLTFVFNPEVIAAVVVAHDGRGDGNFVAHLPFFPPSETATMFEKREIVSPLLARALSSVSSIDAKTAPRFEIKSMRSWGMHATLAERLSTSDGFVGLLGDAAHQYPPSGGFGVNVGIGEADRLGLKLATRYHSSSVSSTSESPLREAIKEYARERLPIARETLKVAIDNYNRGLIPAQCLGLERSAVTVLSQAASTVIPTVGNRIMRSLARIPVGLAISQKDKVEQLRQAAEVDMKALPLFFPQVDVGVDLQKGRLIEGNELNNQLHRIGRLVRHVWFRIRLEDSQQRLVRATRDLVNPFERDVARNNHQWRTDRLFLKTAFCRLKDVDAVRDKMDKEQSKILFRIVAISTQNQVDLIVATRSKTTTKREGDDLLVVVEDIANEFFSERDKDVWCVVVGADGYIEDVIPH